ncbi:unnamed protein product, partial [Owenia fusiformis]
SPCPGSHPRHGVPRESPTPEAEGGRVPFRAQNTDDVIVMAHKDTLKHSIDIQQPSIATLPNFDRIIEMFETIQKSQIDIVTRLDNQEKRMRNIAEEVCQKNIDQVQDDLNAVKSSVKMLTENIQHNISLDLIFRNIAYEQNEDVLAKVNKILKDDMKLLDIYALQAKRVGRFPNSKVVQATFHSTEEREFVLKNKAALSKCANTRKIYINEVKSRETLTAEANLRKIVNMCANDKLTVINGRVLDRQNPMQMQHTNINNRVTSPGNRRRRRSSSVSSAVRQVRQRQNSPQRLNMSADRNVNIPLVRNQRGVAQPIQQVNLPQRARGRRHNSQH